MVEGGGAGYRADGEFIRKIRGNPDDAADISDYLSLNVIVGVGRLHIPFLLRL